jgi:hypothetical protein
MIITDADTPPFVQVASDNDMEKLEGETTPAEEDEADDEGKENIEKEASGDNGGAAGDEETEDGAPEEGKSDEIEGENEGSRGQHMKERKGLRQVVKAQQAGVKPGLSDQQMIPEI